MERFNRSLALSPDSALVKFKRVKVLMALKQFEVSVHKPLDRNKDRSDCSREGRLRWGTCSVCET